jgi:hypothetical protein
MVWCETKQHTVAMHQSTFTLRIACMENAQIVDAVWYALTSCQHPLSSERVYNKVYYARQ